MTGRCRFSASRSSISNTRWRRRGTGRPPRPWPPPPTRAAAAALFDCDSRVRDGVLQALDQGATEVTLWGQTWPAELNDSVGLVEDRPSAAARAFKAQALAAAAMPQASIGLVETFRSRVMAFPSVEADLIPAS